MGESDLEPGQKGLLGNAGTNGKSSGNGSSSNGKHDITASTPVVAVSSHAAHGVKNVHAPMPMARGGLHAQASVGLGNPGKNGFDSPADSPPDSPEGSPAVASSPSDPERDIGNGMTASHVDYATNPIPPQNPVTVMPGMNMNKQLRPTDLVLAAQDVSKIHCSITAIGNAIAGYRLSVVVTADAKAPVSVNGAKLKEKGKPYPLKVGDVLLVGLREMWKIERSVMAEMPPKHVVDELDLYEGHNEFLQLAVSDVETFRNVCRCTTWMDFVAIVVELSEKEQALQSYNNSIHHSQHNSSSFVNTATYLNTNESGSFFRRTDNTMTTLETDPSSETRANWAAGGGGLMNGGNGVGGGSGTNYSLGGNSTDLHRDKEFAMDNGGGQKTLSTFGSSADSEQRTMGDFFPSGGASQTAGTNPGTNDNSMTEEGLPPVASLQNPLDRVPADQASSLPGGASTRENFGAAGGEEGANLIAEYPRCADLVEVLDELGGVLYTFGPLASFDEMAEFDLEEIREVLAPGLFVRIHLCFFPPLVQACAEYLDEGAHKALEKLVGGGNPKSLDRIKLMG
eukprot:g7847.t1